MPAPKRIVSRHVSRRKIWSPSTRPISSRKLFEPRSTTASVAGWRLEQFCGARAAWSELAKRGARSLAESRDAIGRRRKGCVSGCCAIVRRLPISATLLSAMPIDYLEKILTARVYDVAIETPLELAPTLSRRLGNRVLLKREDMQPVFSFKLRGAYNKMAHLPPAQLQARRDRGLRRQPCAGRGARRAAARLPGDHRDAGHHAADQGRRGARRAARRWCCTATPTDDAYAHAHARCRRRAGSPSCIPTTTRT